jgi:hypothetical protein
MVKEWLAEEPAHGKKLICKELESFTPDRGKISF